jgi:hypothetical protein
MIVATPSLKTSNSYVTIEEADTYISDVYRGELSDSWIELTDDKKEHNLKLGALMLNILKYRGEKACRDQALAFPRWWVTDWNKPKYADQYITVDQIPVDLSLTNNYYGSPPAIPDEVKKAQIEITFQVIHSHLLTSTSEPMEYPDHEVRSFTLGGGMTVDYFSTANINSNLFAKDKIQSLAIVDYYLGKWIKRSAGGVA